MTRMTDTERCAGKRADFHVYYRRRNGKLCLDAIWADTADEAKASMFAFARELGWYIEIVRVDAVQADA